MESDSAKPRQVTGLPPEFPNPSSDAGYACGLPVERILPALVTYAHEAYARKQLCLAIDDKGIKYGKVRDPDSLTKEKYAPSSPLSFWRCLKGWRFDSWNEIQSIQMFEEQEFGTIWTLNFKRGRVLRLVIRGKRRDWILPQGAHEVAATAIQAAQPDRLENIATPATDAKNSWGFAFKLFIAWVASILFVMPETFFAQPGWLPLMAQVMSALLCLFTLYRYPFCWWEQFKRRRQLRGKTIDLSKRRQISLPWLGIPIKYISGILFLIAVPIFGLTIPSSPGDWDDSDVNPIGDITFILYLSPLAIYAGYRLSVVRGQNAASADPRPCILFLRAFEDDGKGTFNPRGYISVLLGVNPRGLIAVMNPIRIFRMIITAPMDTAEEQMTGFPT